MYKNSFKQEKRDAIRIAIDLQYDEQCKKELEQAKTSIQLSNILTYARHRKDREEQGQWQKPNYHS